MTRGACDSGSRRLADAELVLRRRAKRRRGRSAGHGCGAGAFVPWLWRLEVANGLFVAMRRKWLDAAYHDKALAQLARLPIAVDGETDAYTWSGALHLSDRFQLTVYDAAYLELAHRRRVPLGTLDRALRIAAGEVGVGVLRGVGATSE